MWKEDFRIGVDIIDEQHRSLFNKTEELISLFRDSGVTKKQECIDTILFLKEYAVNHFADEEMYQLSVGAPNFEEHKAEHQQFINTVLEHESKMISSDFGETEVRNFIAVLLTWLLNHVAGSDQQIGKYTSRKKEQQTTIMDTVRISILEVLNHVAGLDKSIVVVKGESSLSAQTDKIIMSIDLDGEISGSLTFVMPREFAQNLVYAMMRFVPKVIDEFEVSVLVEVLNLMGGLFADHILEQHGKKCSVINIGLSDLEATTTADKLILDTSIGVIEVNVVLSNI